MSGPTIHPAFYVQPVKAVLAGVCLLLLGVFNQPVRAQVGDLIAFSSPGNTAYYLDADTGNDENPGTRADAAWKTLNRVNATAFAPGDKLYIKAGTTYHGMLFPKGAGIPGKPVTIDSFGDGDRPAIHADGEHGAALLLENTNAWHVNNIELSNDADQPEAFRFGISVLAEDTGAVGDFKFTNLHVHDVAGESNPGFGEGAAIVFRNRGDRVPSSFDGILIEHCTIEHAARHGISIESGYVDQPRRPNNTNVVIRSNTITDPAGDGIRLTGCDRAMLEYNTVADAGQSRKGEVGGVALRHSEHCMVQFNDVARTVGRSSSALLDGPDARENTYQFNFTRGNAGAMFTAAAADADATCRYSISQDDHTGLRLIGPVRDARFYNNTVYSGEGGRSVAVQLTPPVVDQSDSTPPTAVIANNLFFTKGVGTIQLGGYPRPGHDGSPALKFMTNAYFGDQAQPDGERDPVTADPLLAAPGQAESIKRGIDGYQLLSGSPLIGTGTRLPSHGRFDFWADPTPAGAAIDIGAHQHGSDKPSTPNPPEKPAAEPAPGP